MRRDFVTQIAWLDRFGVGLHFPIKMAQLFLQQIDLLLLPEHGTIELLDQIFGQARLDFQLGQAIFHGSIFQVQKQVVVGFIPFGAT